VEQPKHSDIDRLIDRALPLDSRQAVPKGFDDRLLMRLRIQAAAQAETRWFRRRAIAAAIAIPGALLAPVVALALLQSPGDYPGGHGLTDYAASQVTWMARSIAAGAMPVVWMMVGLLAAGAAVAVVSGLRRSDRRVG
jgi:hypothetical protein